VTEIGAGIRLTSAIVLGACFLAACARGEDKYMVPGHADFCTQQEARLFVDQVHRIAKSANLAAREDAEGQSLLPGKPRIIFFVNPSDAPALLLVYENLHLGYQVYVDQMPSDSGKKLVSELSAAASAHRCIAPQTPPR
jgi:hypothetical protein